MTALTPREVHLLTATQATAYELRRHLADTHSLVTRSLAYEQLVALHDEAHRTLRQQAREAAAKALFDKYEKWNDKGRFLNADKPFRCSTHNEQNCVLCQKKKPDDA